MKDTAMEQPLTKDLLRDPAIVQLKMRLSREALDVMLYNPVEDNSLIYRRFALPDNDSERLKAIENVIYDNPLLLSGFSKTGILIETRKFIVIPSEANHDDNAEMLIKTAVPEIGKDTSVITNRLPSLGADIVTAVDTPTVNFLRRTFNNASISNSLWPLASFFHAKAQSGDSANTLVNMRQGSLDIITLNSNRLILANRFSWREIPDAAYYILASTKLPGQYPDGIILSGDNRLRDLITPTLRQFHPYVMPMIFPSEMYRAGAVAMSLPFDLVITPLCE